LAAEPDAARTYLPGGRPPRAGEIFRNGDLAASLSTIARDGAGAMYEGSIADAILAASRARGGAMTKDDLREFAPEWVAPIATTYHGWTVHELPPNTQGLAALLMLDLLAQFPLADHGLHTPRERPAVIAAKT